MLKTHKLSLTFVNNLASLTHPFIMQGDIVVIIVSYCKHVSGGKHYHEANLWHLLSPFVAWSDPNRLKTHSEKSSSGST